MIESRPVPVGSRPVPVGSRTARGRTAVAVALAGCSLVLLTAGCGGPTPAEQAAAVCTRTSTAVGALPAIPSRPSTDEVVDILNRQADAGHQGRTDLTTALTDDPATNDRIGPAWDGVVTATEGLRDFVRNPSQSIPYYGQVGTLSALALGVETRRENLGRAVSALHDAATAANVPQCGSIPWRGVLPG